MLLLRDGPLLKLRRFELVYRLRGGPVFELHRLELLHRLRGRQAARWTLAGYGMLILAYLGAKLVLELVLGARWSS